VSITFSPDGKTLGLLASRNWQGTLALWDVARLERLAVLPEHKKVLSNVISSPDGSTLVAAASDGTLLLWDVASHQLLGSPLAGHNEAIENFAFTPDGSTLVSVDAAGTVVLWDGISRLPLGTFVLGHSQGVRSIGLSRDTKVMVSSPTWGDTLILTDLDPESWAKYACEVVNRNLSRKEWEQVVGTGLEYKPACPQLPVAEIDP